MNIFDKIKKEFEEYAFGIHDGSHYIAVLMPYQVDNSNDCNIGNGLLSRYSWGDDYHIVLKEKLSLITNGKHQIFIDSNELNEREIAESLGLGEIGRNQLLLNKRYGTYHFIGIIKLDNYKFTNKINKINNICLKCNKCITSCPNNALSNGFDKKRCLSFITQEKRSLTLEEIGLINNMIFGCDICQIVCPINKSIKQSTFKIIIPSNTREVMLKDIFNMTNKQFKAKFINKAFTWRGKLVVQRNAACIAYNKNIQELKPLIEKSLLNNNTAWYVDTINLILKNWN